MFTNTTEAAPDHSTDEKIFINPISADFVMPAELDKNLYLSIDVKGRKGVDLGIQLKDIYSGSYCFQDLVNKACEFSGLDDISIDTYLGYVIDVLQKNDIK